MRKMIAHMVACAVVSSTFAPHSLSAAEIVTKPIEAKVASVNFDPTVKDLYALYNNLHNDSRALLIRLQKYPELRSYHVLDIRGKIFNSKESEQRRLVEQMQFAQSKLTNSKLVRLKHLQDEAQMQIATLKKRNAQLKVSLKQAISEEEVSWLMWMLSPILPESLAPVVKQKVVAEIARNEVAIEENLKDQQYIRSQLVAALQSFGIQVDQNQINLLFATVTSDQDLELISAYDTVRRLIVLIQDSLQPGQTSIELSKEYYGMYSLLMAALVQIHESQISTIQNVFLPKLDQLIAQAKGNRDQARKLLEKSQNPEMVKANLRASVKMIEVAQMYRGYLIGKIAKLENAAELRQQILEEVLNTYSTYDTAEGILETIKTAQDSLEALDSMNLLEVPKLIDLGDSVMLQQLSQISLEIGQKP